MRNKQNLHTHTTYVDGRDTPEELILEAIHRGFDSIGFSEHSGHRYSWHANQLTEERFALYKEEIRGLKQKYAGVIDVFCGLEFEFYSDLNTEGLDYVIGSAHYLESNGDIKSFDANLAYTVDYVNTCFGGDFFAFAKSYYEKVSHLPKRGRFDIVGHFDLMAKCNEQGGFIDTKSEAYLKLGYEAIHALKGKIPLFEVNTGAIARGYTTVPYPQTEFMKEFLRCGFGAVITSDCHNKNFLDCHFEEARELLRAAGFRSRYILTDGGFREVEL